MRNAHTKHLCNLETSIGCEACKACIIMSSCMGMIALIQSKNLCCIWLTFDNEATCAAAPFCWYLPAMLRKLLLILLLPSGPLTCTNIYMLRCPSITFHILQCLFKPKFNEFGFLLFLEPYVHRIHRIPR